MTEFDNYCCHNNIDYSIAYNELDFYPRGYTFKKPNGRYHIALNGKHDIEQLKKTVIHEIVHITYNHLDKHVLFKELAEREAEFVVEQLNLSLRF